ncbi:vWA domain-containing protein [Methylocystis parvus]|uniref:vWA domain-containing protein n=1 Tax=Methylocystis parvus TaxID=134 RepID=UPI003C777E74
MTEPDFTRLKGVPSPRDAAKRAALAAAMAAFDDPEKKSESETQGTDAPVRLRDASSRTEGKKTMRVSQFNYGLAASIAALMIAAPAAFYLSKFNAPGGGSSLSVSSNGADEGNASAGSAPAPSLREESKQDAVVAAQAPAAPAPAPGVNDHWGTVRGRLGLAPPQIGGPVGGGQVGSAANAPASPARPAKMARQEDKKAERVANVAMPASAPPLAKSKEAARMGANGLMTRAPALQDSADMLPPVAEKEFRDKFDSKDINPVKQVAQEPVSTFSIDVDTASYAFARRMINGGQLPPKDAVRVEEFINYFPYNYPQPESADAPFKPTITVAPSPWNAHNRLVHVAVQGYALQSAQRPRANLVFLVDVSGSMSSEDKLPLVKNALRMLVDELKPEDTVALVTYASGSGVALEPTKIADKGKIIAAIDALGAGGSTAGAQGIQDAYRLAEENFDKAAVNRVILSTDGDFNVGVTDQGELKGLIERKRDKGIFLSILGVGQGNYNDALMQTLAQNGNGTAAYVDNLNEARKVLVEEASSTLFPIAKDVKIQVEWNPARVSEYRLIGYETRALRREDFNNDKVDAGDVGSGHRVTAIYEITPAGEKQLVDDLRYGKKTAEAAGGADGELGFFKLRYKLPKEDESKLLSAPIGGAQAVEKLAAATDDVRFSIAVAAFGQLLKGAPYLGKYDYDDVIALAKGAKGDDPFGYRAEFVNLARLAKTARP